jgi:hypothetical protein
MLLQLLISYTLSVVLFVNLDVSETGRCLIPQVKSLLSWAQSREPVLSSEPRTRILGPHGGGRSGFGPRSVHMVDKVECGGDSSECLGAEPYAAGNMADSLPRLSVHR